MARTWKEVSGLSLAEELGKAERVAWDAIDPEEPWIAWLGHACFLIRWQGASILIDPVFKRWIGLTPRRIPAPDLSKLGRADCVLLSHGHMDHLDRATVRALDPRKIVAPRKAIEFLGEGLRPRCEGVALGDSLQLGKVSVAVVEARHGGWRYPWQRGYIACGFVLSDGRRAVYAAGDTAYGPHFREIGERWKIDTALLPIGAYSPQWFLQKRHLNPEEACAAAKDLGAGRVVPFHFGSYRLSLEPLDEPLRRFIPASKRLGVDWSVPYWL